MYKKGGAKSTFVVSALVCDDSCYAMAARYRWVSLALYSLLAFAGSVLAIGQPTCVAFNSSHSTFPVVQNRKATPILLSPDEWPGVQRTAFDFASDIEQVTGVKPALKNVTSPHPSYSSYGASVIIVGTLGKSSLIDEVVNRTKLDVSSIQGKWEAFLTKEVANPLPGIKSAYVMIGADKRGTIYSLYDHSEQFGTSFSKMRRLLRRSLRTRNVGVSPWYWYESFSDGSYGHFC